MNLTQIELLESQLKRLNSGDYKMDDRIVNNLTSTWVIYLTYPAMGGAADRGSRGRRLGPRPGRAAQPLPRQCREGCQGGRGRGTGEAAGRPALCTAAAAAAGPRAGPKRGAARGAGTGVEARSWRGEEEEKDGRLWRTSPE